MKNATDSPASLFKYFFYFVANEVLKSYDTLKWKGARGRLGRNSIVEHKNVNFSFNIDYFLSIFRKWLKNA